MSRISANQQGTSLFMGLITVGLVCVILMGMVALYQILKRDQDITNTITAVIAIQIEAEKIRTIGGSINDGSLMPLMSRVDVLPATVKFRHGLALHPLGGPLDVRRKKNFIQIELGALSPFQCERIVQLFPYDSQGEYLHYVMIGQDVYDLQTPGWVGDMITSCSSGKLVDLSFIFM